MCVRIQLELAINQSSSNSFRSKHIDIRFHFIQELVTRKIVSLKLVPSKENAAGLFHETGGLDSRAVCS